MRYTVLGASGFIGQHLVAALNSSGLDCFAPARNAAAIFEQDLGLVFYCIGLTADYRQRPFDTIQAHVSYLAELLESAKFERLVYLSSTRLYDSSSAVSGHEDQPLSLKPADPRHLYDLSKALGENLCLTASDKASVARLSCVYSPRAGSPGFLSQLLQRLPRERCFSLDSSSGLVRDYIHIDDVVLALQAILRQPAGDIYNLASGENVSNLELVETINSAGYQLSLQHESARQEAPVCDISKLRSELNIQPVRVRDFILQHLAGIGHEPG